MGGPQKVLSRQMFVLEGYLRGRAPEGYLRERAPEGQ